MTERERVALQRVLFEFVRMGKAVKVTAIDPQTGTEVSMVGDSHAGPEALKQLAKRKLEYVIAKRQQNGS